MAGPGNPDQARVEGAVQARRFHLALYSAFAHRGHSTQAVIKKSIIVRRKNK